MKGFIYLLLTLAFLVVAASLFWWVAEDVPFAEQVEIVKAKVGENIEDSAASNTAESASKLGRVLKNNFDEAQDVYQHGAEAKYE